MTVAAETILVVDDEQHIVELAKLYLENEGFHVESAADGREALEKVRARPELAEEIVTAGADSKIWAELEALARESLGSSKTNGIPGSPEEKD